MGVSIDIRTLLVPHQRRLTWFFVLFQKDQSVSGLTEIKEVGSQERLLDEEWIFTGEVREKENESVAAIAAEMR